MKKLILIAALMSAISAVAQTPAAPPPMAKPGLTLTTTAFEDGGIIPNKYTQAAENGAPVSPSLTWTNVPDGVVSFALILIDPDTSLTKTTNEVLHWMIFNIPSTARDLPEGVPAQAAARWVDPGAEPRPKGRIYGHGRAGTRTLSSLHVPAVCTGYQAEPRSGCDPSRCDEGDGRTYSRQGCVGGAFPSSLKAGT
jgi:phosphatidylethanolamine-binding protein (PEBP) family uncharacterized protein